MTREPLKSCDAQLVWGQLGRILIETDALRYQAPAPAVVLAP